MDQLTLNQLAVGNNVTWNYSGEEELGIIDVMVDRYGEGPFRIVELLPVPMSHDFCPVDRNAHGGNDIITDMFMDMDHPELGSRQRVVVLSPEGKVLKDSDGYQINFDAIWFQRS
jgi:hypothetical protein